LRQEYSYQKLSKSDNCFLSYGRKCRGCFFRHSVQSARKSAYLRQAKCTQTDRHNDGQNDQSQNLL